MFVLDLALTTKTRTETIFRDTQVRCLCVDKGSLSFADFAFEDVDAEFDGSRFLQSFDYSSVKLADVKTAAQVFRGRCVIWIFETNNPVQNGSRDLHCLQYAALAFQKQ
jgi:hypothetical protein